MSAAGVALRRPILNFRSDTRGQALIEFGLVSVIFFATVFGIISFGLAIYEYNATALLSREGARYAALHGSKSGSAATSSSVQTYLRTRSFGLQVTAAITCAAPGATLAACGTCASGVCTNDPGNVVQVVVQQTFTPFTTLVPHSAMTLTSTAQMIIAR
jgi:Flp pilus assembly protein TadG